MLHNHNNGNNKCFPLVKLFYGFSGFLFLCVIVIKMIAKGGARQACAACKYRRRKCAANCPLARFFPADQPQMFFNVHRLFGLSNIGKILRQVAEDRRDEAMKTIIFESTVRARYPVHGCWGLICKLQQQLQASLEELRVVNASLAICKEQAPPASPSELSTLSSNINDALDENQVPIPLNDVQLNELHASIPFPETDVVVSMPLVQNNIVEPGKALKVEDPYYYNICNDAIRKFPSPGNINPGHQQIQVSHHDDSIPLIDTTEIYRKPYIHSKGASESR